MNTWRIQHHQLTVRKRPDQPQTATVAAEAATPPTREKEPSSSKTIPLRSKAISTTVTSSFETGSSSPPQPTVTPPHAPLTAASLTPRTRDKHETYVLPSGRKIVQSELSSTSNTLHPRSIYNHSEGFLYCTPTVRPAPERPRTIAKPMTLEEQLALQDRLKQSEERVVTRRAPRRPTSAPSDPPHVQMLVTRLTSAGRQRVDRHEQQQPPVGARSTMAVASDEDTDPLHATTSITIMNPEAASPHSSGGDKDVLSTTSRDAELDTGLGAPPDGATEARIHSKLLDAEERIKDQLVHARSEMQRQILQEELQRLKNVFMHCHSTVGNVDLSTHRLREGFQAAIRVDNFSAEELQGKLLYGEYARQIVLKTQHARVATLRQCLSERQPLTAEMRLERATSAQRRRLEQAVITRDMNSETVDEWRERTSTCHSLDFHERQAAMLRHELQRRASMWSGILIALSYPTQLIQNRAVYMERRALARRPAADVVQLFVDKMREVVRNRRRRVAHGHMVVWQCGTQLLMLCLRHQRRRHAVGEIIAWFTEYSRRRPAVDMIAKFKQTIIRCQRIVRKWIARRRLQECWALLRLMQCDTCIDWSGTPPAPAASSVHRGRRIVSKLPPATKKKSPDPIAALIDPIVSCAIPPLFLRLEAIRAMWKDISRHYVAELCAYLKSQRLEKKRAAIRPRSVHAYASTDDFKSPTMPRPFHMLIPPEAMLVRIKGEVREQFSTWLKQAVLDHMESEQTTELPSLPIIRGWLRDTEEFHMIKTWAPFILIDSNVLSRRTSQTSTSPRTTPTTSNKRVWRALETSGGSSTASRTLNDARDVYRQALNLLRHDATRALGAVTTQ